MNETSICPVCDSMRANVIRVGSVGACDDCVRAVARWIAAKPTERLDWTDVDVAHILAIATGYTSGPLSPEDVAAHADLAIAYGEMGLLSDAVLTASLAIVGSGDGPIVRRAAEVLLRDGAAVFTAYGENRRRS